MISDATRNTFQSLRRFIHKSNVYVIIPVVMVPLLYCVPLYLSLQGIALMAAHAPAVLSLGMGNYILNSMLLSVALTFISIVGVAAGTLVGGIAFRAIVETTNLLFSLRIRPALILIPSVLTGSLIGSWATIKIGLTVATNFAANSLPLFELLISAVGAPTLIIIPSALGISVTLFAIFNVKAREFIQNAITKVLKTISETNLILGLGALTGNFPLALLSASAAIVGKVADVKKIPLILGLGLGALAGTLSIPTSLILCLTAGALFVGRADRNKVNLILGLGIGALLGSLSFSAGLIATISVSAIILAKAITETTFVINKSFYKVLYHLTFSIKDKNLSLQVLLNLHKDDPLLAQLAPQEAEIKTLLKSLFLKGMTYHDFTQDTNLLSCLNHLGENSESEALSSLIKLGADPLECLSLKQEEKAAQELMPVESAITSTADLKLNTLQWQAAKVLARHNISIPDAAPAVIKEFVAKAKAAL